MRNNNTHHVASSSTFQGVEQKMTLDQNSLAHLMTVLTDLYSDPMLAVIREYSTNALDSHLAAGVKAPIVVNLPNDLNPSFEVTDHGVGLSVDDLVNVYSKYGYSTKRDNDVEAGMLGLGCKAGLTYTDQFTVTAVKDGVRALAVVARGEDGTGSIRIVDTSSTVERNGVTISVPVSNTSRFNQTAKGFFRFWEPGTVLVDGVEPTLGGVQVSDDITIVDGDLAYDYVVMGNIGYPVERYQHNLSSGLPYRFNVVARVPMGSINFTPSREALNYTALTNAKLQQITADVSTKARAAAQRDINAATTAPDVLDAVLKWWGIASGPFTFQGQTVPNQFTAKDGIIDYSPARYRKKAERTGSVDIRTMKDEKSVLIEGFSPKALTPTHRAKLAQYCDENDIEATRFFITDEPLGLPWTANVPRIKWEDVKAIKLPRKGGGGGKQGDPEPIKVYDGTSWEELDNNDKGKDIVLISPANKDLDAGMVRKAFPGKRVAVLGKNRWDKFLRERPLAEKAEDIIIDRIAEFDEALTDSDLLNLSGTYGLSVPSTLDADRVDDPELADAIRTIHGAQTSTARNNRYDLVKVAEHLGRWQDVPGRPKCAKVDDLSATLDKYPFLRYAGSINNASHTYEYLNAVHAERESN